MTSPGPAAAAADLDALTGIRSSKRNYYPEYRRSAERLERAVRALDAISWALGRTVEGPRPVLEAVVHAACDHMRAQWTLLALARGALPESRPRFLVLDPGGRMIDRVDDLPEALVGELEQLRTADWSAPHRYAGPWLRVPMTLDGDPVGGLSGMIDERPEADASEVSVLRILANQAAVAMHNSAMYQASLTLRTRSEQLYAEASRHARQLAQRNEELQQTQRQLLVAHERELLDTERHRIARELHDSVTQQVLSAGMVVDVCRTDVTALGGAGEAVAERLAAARDLTRDAVAQLRSAIWALSRDEVPDEMRGLPVLLQQVARQHRAHLHVTLKIEGARVGLSAEVEHALARIAGEALFNTARHSSASRALVRLSYRPSCVRLAIGDDGDGDPVALRRRLRQELADRADGHHGLANMTTRAQELGGSFAVRRAKLGGVRIEVEVPRADVSARSGSVLTDAAGGAP